jgi:CRISPR-associated endoribonuclease Cas6
MRGRISLITEDNDYFLPYSYPYHLASALYQSLAQVVPKYAKELHNRSTFKFFTFSWLQFPRRIATPKGLQIFSRQSRFFITSPDEQLFRALMQGLLETSSITLDGHNFDVQGIGVLPREFIRPGDWFSTLSPILLRIFVDPHQKGGEREGPKVWDILPDDPRFKEQLNKNLVRKFKAFYGYIPQGELTIREIRRIRNKRVAIRDTWHRASHLLMQLGGNQELLQFGYDCGFGERNSLGFGMVSRQETIKSREVMVSEIVDGGGTSIARE